MRREKREMKVIAAVISSVLLSNESGESIEPSIGREGGSPWSVSHRRMIIGKTPLLKARSDRSSKR
jgi:hypothetical protein